MPYSPQLCESLTSEAHEICAQLDLTLLALGNATSGALPVRSIEHLSQGAGRRVGILAHCLTTIFEKFPPGSAAPLERPVLYDVQVAHHAFVVNLYGFFENLAWAFILRHALETKVGGRKNIGLFLKSTQRLLPVPIRDYLASPTMVAWHNDYLKNYRDALAHRVPLYIPPSAISDTDVAELMSLRERERVAILERNWNVLEEIRERESAVGRPCFFLCTRSVTTRIPDQSTCTHKCFAMQRR